MLPTSLRLAVYTAALLTAACTSMAPPYERPTVELPDTYASNALSQTSQEPPADLLDWHSYFTDPTLTQLIKQALERNTQLRTAVLRVQEAQAAYGIQRSDRRPALGLGAEASRVRTPADLNPGGQAIHASQFQVGVGISSWEIDFWGRVASLDEAALQSFLSTDAARRATTVVLVAQVADLWLGLHELEERLRLAQANETNQRESWRIFTRRFTVGSASRLELTQVETLLTEAESLVTQLRRQQEAQRLALSILIGDLSGNAAEVKEGASLSNDVPPILAPGLPSDLLLDRPDVVAAEHSLRAANANIGAARAAFFPRIGLTTFGGVASNELAGLFRGANRTWSFVPNLTLPIFDGGRNQANLDLAEVRKNLAIVHYEQTVQNAFREVADALSAQHWLQQQVQVQRRALEVQQERVRLSRLSYESGASSFLEVLDAERSLIRAEQQLVQTQGALLSSRVALYAALGGGSRTQHDGPLLPTPSNLTNPVIR